MSTNKLLKIKFGDQYYYFPNKRILDLFYKNVINPLTAFMRLRNIEKKKKENRNKGDK